MARWGEAQPGLRPLDVRGPDGCRTRAWIGGEGPPLLLIHGLGWDHSLWAAEIARLRPSHRIIAPDLRGHGASDKPGGPYDLERLADDLLAVLGALGGERLAVVGFSLGGAVAIALADRLGTRLGALVLAGCGYRRPADRAARTEEVIGRMRLLGPEGFAAAQGEIVFGPRFRAEYPDEVRRFVAWRAAMPVEPLFSAMRGSPGFDGTGALGRLQAPLLAIAAEADPFVPVAEMVAAAHLAPDGRFTLIRESGHHMMIEQPGPFAAALDSFLAESWPSRPRATSLG